MNNNDDELRSVLTQLQTYEENLPESIKTTTQREENKDIARQQLREIKLISKNVKIITAILIVNLIAEFFLALLIFNR